MLQSHQDGEESLPKTLASARPDGESVAIVQNTDGTVAITIAGSEIPHYRWEAAQIEDCINAYMRLLRG